MNRIIKFRVWDIYNKEMIYYPTVSIQSHEFDLDTGYGETLLNDQFISNRRIYQQFTDLTDKNGKEIYEGDILSDPYHSTGIVKYESDYGGYIVEYEYSKNQHHVLLTCDIAYISEIIGNIYENKDLI